MKQLLDEKESNLPRVGKIKYLYRDRKYLGKKGDLRGQMHFDFGTDEQDKHIEMPVKEDVEE